MGWLDRLRAVPEDARLPAIAKTRQWIDVDLDRSLDRLTAEIERAGIARIPVHQRTASTGRTQWYEPAFFGWVIQVKAHRPASDFADRWNISTEMIAIGTEHLVSCPHSPVMPGREPPPQKAYLGSKPVTRVGLPARGGWIAASALHRLPTYVDPAKVTEAIRYGHAEPLSAGAICVLTYAD